MQLIRHYCRHTAACRRLMKQYKKPLLQSAFDLQSRLANQVNLRSAPYAVAVAAGWGLGRSVRSAYFGSPYVNRIANTLIPSQVRSNFLCKFANQGDRDKEYARLNMAFVIAEFLGWLEVIRQEIVFIVGEGTANLNMIIDAIKFQFTGDTPCQGGC